MPGGPCFFSIYSDHLWALGQVWWAINTAHRLVKSSSPLQQFPRSCLQKDRKGRFWCQRNGSINVIYIPAFCQEITSILNTGHHNILGFNKSGNSSQMLQRIFGPNLINLWNTSHHKIKINSFSFLNFSMHKH